MCVKTEGPSPGSGLAFQHCGTAAAEHPDLNVGTQDLTPDHQEMRMNAWCWIGHGRRALVPALVVLALIALAAPAALAQTSAAPAAATHQGGGEASLKIPDLGQVQFGGVNGRSLLMVGLVVCVLGLGFGLVIYTQLKNLPVHQSMRD